jgi:hypothetical protein
MAWTVLSDATLEVGKALRALTMRNLRDNITAVANGDAGAPQIQTAAIAGSAVTAAKIAAGNVLTANIADGNVTTAKIADANVTSGKLAATTNEVNWVLARTAGATTGAVGSYAFLTNVNAGTHTEGSNYAGNILYGPNGSGGAAGGTWKCMGRAASSQSTVYLRIA